MTSEGDRDIPLRNFPGLNQSTFNAPSLLTEQRKQPGSFIVLSSTVKQYPQNKKERCISKIAAGGLTERISSTYLLDGQNKVT